MTDASPVPASTPNDAPEALLALAELALSRGFDSVSLGFGGLGADFPAPISWMLHLTRTDFSTYYSVHGEAPPKGFDKAEHLVIDLQRSAEQEDGTRGPDKIQAYRGYPEGVAFGDADHDPYWDETRIREWILEETELLPACTPEETAQYLADWSLMRTAYLNGWSAKRELRRGDQMSFARHMPEGNAPLPLVAPINIDALNHFYNVKGHPDNRNTRTEVSVSAHLTAVIGEELDDDERAILHLEQRRVKGSDNAVYTTRQAFEDVAGSRAPWFVPVAGFTEETEEDEGGWVLPPEATAWKDEKTKESAAASE